MNASHRNESPIIPARRSAVRCASPVFVWTLILLAVASPTFVGAADWAGQEEDRDGILHVVSPAEPANGLATLKLERLWEVGGDEEEEFLFGVLTQITSDTDGNIYLLDAQLNEVVIFSSSGDYIRSVGREGEGPGEFRRPSDLFLTASGDIAVLQRMPGKIVLLTPDGEPVGNMPTPEPQDGGMQMFFGGRLAGDHIVLQTMRFARRETGFETRVELKSVDAAGNELATYYSADDSRSFASMEIDEKTFGGNALVWAAGNDGRVYTSDNFDAYRFSVLASDGTVERVVEREYKSRVRSNAEKEMFKPRVRMRRGGRTMSPEVKASDTDRDIQEIVPRENGSTWVLSSKGAFDVPAGTIAIFDVFDRAGKFTTQVALEGDGNYRQDGLHVVGNRLYVVKGFRSARQAWVGASDNDEQEDDAEPMRVICYGLGMIARG